MRLLSWIWYCNIIVDILLTFVVIMLQQQY